MYFDSGTSKHTELDFDNLRALIEEKKFYMLIRNQFCYCYGAILNYFDNFVMVFSIELILASICDMINTVEYFKFSKHFQSYIYFLIFIIPDNSLVV